jgi:hypothetical protein
MKMLTALKSCLIVTTLGLSSANQDIKFDIPGAAGDSLITCMTLPYCGGGSDVFSPVLQPKDSKTETEDAKDEKLA